MTIYMIRHKGNKKFSRGGQWPIFRSVGKIWNTLGHIKTHLRQKSYGIQTKIQDWEVVEFDITEVKATEAKDFLKQ